MKLNNRNPHRGDDKDETGVKWSDSDIQNFLQDLDDNPDIELSNWEAEFVESNLSRTTFSPKQRQVIKRLDEKYGHSN